MANGTYTRQSNIFRPPQTPLDTNSSTRRSLPNNTLTIPTPQQSRKRSRPTSSHGEFATPVTHPAENGWLAMSTGSSIVRSDAASPLPFVNTTYMLKGGLDTPSLEVEARYDGANDVREVDFRRRWSDGSVTSPEEEYGAGIRQPAPRAANGRALVQGASPTSGWGAVMFNFVGGVAGKMWDFCNTRVFKGFHAGGGVGYDLRRSEAEQRAWAEGSVWEDLTPQEEQQEEHARRIARQPSPMPGMWPEPWAEHYAADDSHHPQHESPSHRPAKRLHTDTGQGWVMVDYYNHNSSSRRTRSPARPLARRNPSSQSHIPRPTPSRTPSRRALQPVSRRSATAAPTIPQSTSPIALQAHHRKHSSWNIPLSARKPLTPTSSSRAGEGGKDRPGSGGGGGGGGAQSPLSAAAQRHADRLRREERQADASMRRLNERLAAMIREGREALGSKVEVELLDEPGGFGGVEDEGFGEGV